MAYDAGETMKTAVKVDLKVGSWIAYGFAMAMILLATTVLAYVAYHYMLVNTYNTHIADDQKAQALATLAESADALAEASALNGKVMDAPPFELDTSQFASLEVVILASVEQGGYRPFAITIGIALMLFAVMAAVVPHPHHHRAAHRK